MLDKPFISYIHSVDTTREVEEDTSNESPITDDDDDFALRAMAFAKMRAASRGMGAAMIEFNSTFLSDSEDDSEVSSSRINSVASSVISTISNGEYAILMMAFRLRHHA